MLRNYENFGSVTPKGSFKTVFFANQECGEIDPAFVHKFNDDLPRIWTIMNYSYMHHVVSFNKDDTYPLITLGWTQMKEHFHLNDKDELQFAYFGDGLFGMTVKKYRGQQQIPKFHSRFVDKYAIGNFFVIITTDTMTKPYLSIWDDFETFVREYNFSTMTAFNDNGTTTLFNIAKTDHPLKTTAIGVGWMEYCAMKNFEAGDVICFKFISIRDNGVALHIFKLDL